MAQCLVLKRHLVVGISLTKLIINSIFDTSYTCEFILFIYLFVSCSSQVSFFCLNFLKFFSSCFSYLSFCVIFYLTILFQNQSQITGELDACKQALQSISQQLLENPPRDYDIVSTNPTGSSSHLFGPPLPRSEAQPPPNYSFPAQGAPYAAGVRDTDYHSNTPQLHKFHESGMPGRMKPQDILTFRLLCHDERVGGIIGKGGTIIKNLQNETGCEIKVLDGVPDSEDRVIFISGSAVQFYFTLDVLNFIFSIFFQSHFSCSMRPKFIHADEKFN